MFGDSTPVFRFSHRDLTAALSPLLVLLTIACCTATTIVICTSYYYVNLLSARFCTRNTWNYRPIRPPAAESSGRGAGGANRRAVTFRVGMLPARSSIAARKTANPRRTSLAFSPSESPPTKLCLRVGRWNTRIWFFCANNSPKTYSRSLKHYDKIAVLSTLHREIRIKIKNGSHEGISYLHAAYYRRGITFM